MPLPLPRRRFSTILLAGAMGWPLTRAEESTDAQKHRDLDFEIGSDFEADVDNVRAVLRSAGEAIWKHCPNTHWQVPGFYIYWREESPIALHDHRKDGRIAVGLTTRGNYWSQFAFQFAHEFCHALTSHSNDWRKRSIRDRQANFWLEECLCETASLFVLRSMSETWKTDAPYPNWTSYAERHADYVKERLDQSTAQLPANFVFKKWFAENEPALRKSATLRDKNLIIASKLLPLFEAEPAGWESVTFLNLAPEVPGSSLSDHFKTWSDTAPAAQRPFIGKLAALFS